MLRRFGTRRTARAAVLLMGCAIALLAIAWSRDDGTAHGAQTLSLRGTWTGHRERISSTDGYRNGTATLRVTQQTGMTFKGTMQWSTPDGPIHEALIGAFTPGGALMAGGDAAGTYSFSLVNAKTLDYCYVEHTKGYRTTCARLKKQS